MKKKSCNSEYVHGPPDKCEVYMNILESVSDYIAIIDFSGRYVYASPSHRQLGYDSGNLVGKLAINMIPLEDKLRLLPVLVKFGKRVALAKAQTLDAIRKELAGMRLNFGYRDASGKLHCFESSSCLVKHPSGTGYAVLLISRDITERQKMHDELINLKFGLEHSPDAVFITDIEGIIVYANPAFEKIYGYKKEEALGHTPRIIKSGMIPAKQYKQFWGTLLAKRTVAGEIVNKRKDGTLVPIEGSNNPILDERGKITGFLAIHHDITQRKKAEEQIKLANERMEEAGNIAKFGRWDWDISTGALNWSNQVYEIYGMDPKKDKPTYKTVVDTLIPEFKKEFLDAVGGALKGDKHFELDSGLIRPDGTRRYTHTFGRVLRDKTGKPLSMFGVVQDITDRRIADDAVKNANRELHEKVEELERFNKLTVGRELKMIELKKRINELEGKIRGEQT